ncbi:hypothetical protein NDU88_006463 [Pleurodeles waltl]|uniref:Uncharacterized protein n=1 Tax=Pleurodeles waltl TaxID=8319 RepID=A0AAV7WAT9_PLEWA|nr:hypothetical protein NDU88_006463 [Pleurodeles waltl]
MPRSKTASKTPGKPARQLLFSEALRQQKHSPTEDLPPPAHTIMADDTQGATMDRILQQISAARQLLRAARMQRPFRSGTLDIRLLADFSKETAERRKAFLSLRTRLRHLDVKFGLFEPARMWITKNGESRNFYDRRT